MNSIQLLVVFLCAELCSLRTLETRDQESIKIKDAITAWRKDVLKLQVLALALAKSNRPYVNFGRVVPKSDALRFVKEEFEAEVGKLRVSFPQVPQQRKFIDADFDYYEGVQHASLAGPDAPHLAKVVDAKRITGVHTTISPVLDVSECNMLRKEATSAIDRGFSSRFTYAESAGIREVHVQDLPKLDAWLKEKLTTIFYPLIASRYGSNVSNLYLHDSLIIEYNASRNSSKLPRHRDSSVFSLNIALNDEFTGGGTWFETGEIVRLRKGHCACHVSGIRHAGNKITSGVRWILVVFVRDMTMPQLERRCFDTSMFARKEYDVALREGRSDAAATFLNEAFAAAEMGIELAPFDYEGYISVAYLYQRQGNGAKAREYFRKAISKYPVCAEARIGLGNLLLDSKRTRAALRQFEYVYLRETIGNYSIPFEDASVQEAGQNLVASAISLLQQYDVAPISLDIVISVLLRLLDAGHGDQRYLESLLREARVMQDYGTSFARAPLWEKVGKVLERWWWSNVGR